MSNICNRYYQLKILFNQKFKKMKKIEWSTVVEVGLGILIAGVVLIAVHNLFGGWVASHGSKITGKSPDGSNFEGE